MSPTCGICRRVSAQTAIAERNASARSWVASFVLIVGCESRNPLQELAIRSRSQRTMRRERRRDTPTPRSLYGSGKERQVRTANGTERHFVSEGRIQPLTHGIAANDDGKSSWIDPARSWSAAGLCPGATARSCLVVGWSGIFGRHRGTRWTLREMTSARARTGPRCPRIAG